MLFHRTASPAGQTRRHPGRCYRFPAGVTLRLIAGPEITAHFDAEYGELRSDDGDSCDLEVRADGYHSIIHALRRDGANICELKARHKTLTWHVAIWGLEEQTTHVAFKGTGQMAISFLQTFYVEPLLRLKILQKGHALVHACAVMQGAKVIVFAGGTGVGKTTLALRQIARGKGVLGDNYIVLSPAGEAFTVHRRMRVYSDLSRSNPALYRSLAMRHRLTLRAHGIIKLLSRGFADLPVRLSIRELAPDAGVAAAGGALESIYVLVPRTGGEVVGPTPLSLEDVVRRVQEHNIAEAERLRQAIGAYIANHPASQFKTVDAIERDVLRRAFEGVPAFELQIPRVDAPAAMADQIARITGIE